MLLALELELVVLQLWVAAGFESAAERASGDAATGSGSASGWMQQAGHQQALQQALTGFQQLGSTEHKECMG